MDEEGIYVEPSGVAGLAGVMQYNSEPFRQYVEEHDLTQSIANATQIVWATGGSLEPDNPCTA